MEMWNKTGLLLMTSSGMVSDEKVMYLIELFILDNILRQLNYIFFLAVLNRDVKVRMILNEKVKMKIDRTGYLLELMDLNEQKNGTLIEIKVLEVSQNMEEFLLTFKLSTPIAHLSFTDPWPFTIKNGWKFARRFSGWVNGLALLAGGCPPSCWAASTLSSSFWAVNLDKQQDKYFLSRVVNLVVETAGPGRGSI